MEQKLNKKISPISLENPLDKILVFGGVYSNLQALEALYQVSKDLNISSGNIICTGDIIGYCAQPSECIQFIKDWKIHSIAGNVELQIAEQQLDCGCDFTAESRCDILSKTWYPYALDKVKGKDLNFVQRLPEFIRFPYGKYQIGVVHGSYQHTSAFVFKSSPWKDKENSFDDMQVDVILAGHGGLPFNDCRDDTYWLNAGVIGMPANDGNTDVWYMVLQLDKTGKLLIEHKQLQYDYQLAADLMRKAKLPESYAQTLVTGIWDNCDILPETETNQQGKKIDI